MPDEKMSPPARMEPITVTVIGTGPGTLATGTVGKTPIGQSNMIAVVVTPIVALAARFAHAYGAALLGLMTGIPMLAKMGDTPLVPFSDFWDLLVKSSTLALAGPLLELLRDIVAIFGRLKDKYPLLSGQT